LKNIFLVFFILLVITGCLSAQKPLTNDHIVAEGQLIYERECLACHMRDGRGVPGMIPGLLESVWLQGPNDSLIGYILTGGFGPQVQMARFDFLSNEEIAKVLTYSRLVYLNKRSIISNDEVRKVRNQIELLE
tara:strand:+ start:194 stop:592 length:399 start_codon:yes stop_codon:yes gene_type:complete